MIEEPYKHHLFFCVNRRDGGKQCCAGCDAQALRDYVKRRVKDLGLDGEGRARVNQAGCLGRCAEGPVVVVYPEGVWYTYVDQEDLDEIIAEHLLNGRTVDRLRI